MTATHLDVRLLNEAREEIGDIIEGRSGVIVSGVLDYPEYRYRSGEVAGLQLALGIMQEIVRKMGDHNKL